MKLLGHDLDDHQYEQGRQKNSRAGQVAQIPGHGDSVATSLTKRRGKNFDDPKTECDLGNFADVMLRVGGHLIRCSLPCACDKLSSAEVTIFGQETTSQCALTELKPGR